MFIFSFFEKKLESTISFSLCWSVHIKMLENAVGEEVKLVASGKWAQMKERVLVLLSLGKRVEH